MDLIWLQWIWLDAPNALLMEADPVVAALWQYLIKVKSSEILSLPLVEEGQLVDDLAVAAEAKTLFGFWCNPGNCRPGRKAGSWMRSGKWPYSTWSEVTRARIASQVHKIRGWEARCGSYADIEPGGYLVH